MARWPLIFAACLLVTVAARADVSVKELRMPNGMVVHPVVEVAHGEHYLVSLVVRKPSGEKVQTLEIGPVQVDYVDLSSVITFEDFNFDGYPDIRYIDENYAGGNTLGSVWLFDPKTGQFVQNQELGDITNLRVDARRRVLTSDSRGEAGAGYTKQELQWQGGHPVVMREEEQGTMEPPPGPNKLRVHRTIKVRRRGQLRLTDDFVIDITIKPWGHETIISHKTY